MLIHKPSLPINPGYVEVEVDGVRQYKKIPTELDLYKDEQAQKAVESAQYLLDLDFRLSLMELGVVR